MENERKYCQVKGCGFETEVSGAQFCAEDGSALGDVPYRSDFRKSVEVIGKDIGGLAKRIIGSVENRRKAKKEAKEIKRIEKDLVLGERRRKARENIRLQKENCIANPNQNKTTDWVNEGYKAGFAVLNGLSLHAIPTFIGQMKRDSNRVDNYITDSLGIVRRDGESFGAHLKYACGCITGMTTTALALTAMYKLSDSNVDLLTIPLITNGLSYLHERFWMNNDSVSCLEKEISEERAGLEEGA